MNQVAETLQDTVKLLAALDLDEAISTSGDILLQKLRPAALGIAAWNSSSEKATNSTLFGAQRKYFQNYFEAFLGVQTGVPEAIKEVNGEVLDIMLPPQLKPVFACPLLNNNELAGYMLVAGANLTPAHIHTVLNSHHVGLALSRAWKYKQLEQENQFFRTQYEELKARVLATEESNRELIREVISKDTLNTRRVEHDALMYNISSTVCSSLPTSEILQNAMTEIGKAFNASHCILICPSDNQQIVHEWHSHTELPLAEHFATVPGVKFIQKSMACCVPQILSKTVIAQQDKSFLSKLGLNSGITIPLILQDKVLGAIVLRSPDPERQWGADDTSLLVYLANQLSLSIENAQLHHESEVQTITDSLTGMANRRHFDDVFVKEIARSKRYGHPLSLIVLNLDHLRRINEKYGYQMGDRAIQNTARILQRSSRSIDLVARYEGEKFCLLLPNTDLDKAKQMGQRLRQLISAQHLNGNGKVTASVGIASFPLHASNCDELLHMADEAMYRAKQAGRNRAYAAR